MSQLFVLTGLYQRSLEADGGAMFAAVPKVSALKCGSPLYTCVNRIILYIGLGTNALLTISAEVSI